MNDWPRRDLIMTQKITKSNLYMLSMMKMVMVTVSDEELSHIKEIKQTETQLRKNLAQT